MIVAAFPRTLLPVPYAQARELTATRFARDEGIGGLVATLVRQLPAQLGHSHTASSARLGTAVLDLIGAVMADRLDGDGALPPGGRQAAMMMRIRAFIEERLSDPAMSPEMIAAAHHISVRYLYKLFQAEATTVSGWIRRRRLERCRRDLLDPALCDRPVSAIAARWGSCGPLTSADCSGRRTVRRLLSFETPP